jgi:hypothetical protein
MRGVPLWVAIEKRFPDVLPEAADLAWKVKESGGSDAQILSAMRSVMPHVHVALRSQADDVSLKLFAELALDQMKAVRAINYEACTKFLAAKLDLTQVLPKEYTEREEAWLLGALASGNAVRTKRNEQALVAAIQVAVSRMSPPLVDVVANPSSYENRPDLLCDANIGLYEAVLSLPPRQRVAGLQGLLIE